MRTKSRPRVCNLAIEAGVGVPESVVGLQRCGRVGGAIGYGVGESGNPER